MSELIPFDTSCQAEYADGFILDETALNDENPYSTGGNTFRAILNREPEPEHGAMVRFSVFYKDARYDIDWTTLPDNARPIRFRDRSSFLTVNGQMGVTDWEGMRFGYQYNDVDGHNHQEIQEL